MPNNKIKILHVIPSVNTCGGIERYVFSLCKYVGNSDFHFDILHHRWKENFNIGEKLDKDFEKLGCKVYSVCDPSESLLKFFNETKEFFKLHNNYDVIHVHSTGTSSRFLYLAKHYQIPVRIFHCHEEKLSDKFSHRLRNMFLIKFSKHYATDYIAVSNVIGNVHFNNKKYYLVYCGLDWKNFVYSVDARSQIRNKENIKPNTFVVGCVGRFSKTKNFSYMVFLFLEILKLRADSVLVFVGDGPQKDKIKQLVRKLDIEKKVIFLGNVKNMSKIYSAFDVFVMPSIHEGLPVSCLEAQASGLPCFLSDTITDECNVNKCYYFSLKDDKTTIANRIINVDSSYRLSNIFAKSRFDTGNFADSMIEIYRRMLKEKKC